MISQPILLEDPRTNREHFFQCQYHLEEGDQVVITQCWLVVCKPKKGIWLTGFNPDDYETTKTFDIWDIVKKIDRGYEYENPVESHLGFYRRLVPAEWPGLYD